VRDNGLHNFIGKPEGRRTLGRLGRPKNEWEDNINSLKKLGSENVDWIGLAQNREQGWILLVNTIMKRWVPNKVRKFLTS
jgi:hypothetical protein